MKDWLIKTSIRLLPIFLFFFISFWMINFTLGLSLRSKGIEPYGMGSLFLAALVVAKVFMLAEHLPFVNLFPTKPAIWNIIWKTFVYSVLSFLIRGFFRLMPFLIKEKSFILGWQQFVAVVEIPFFLALQVWYILLFFVFVFGFEIFAKVGFVTVRKLLFGR